MSCITTFTRKAVDPLTAKAEEILAPDIAHALSLLCRANGHFPHFYSVGQHCINCMKEARARGYSHRVQLGCLLHDASEAYLSDITRPVKPVLPEYLRYEKRLQDLIFDKWITPSLSEEERAQILEIDDVLFYHEFLVLMDRRVIPEEPPLYSKPIFEFRSFEAVEKEYLHALSGREDSALAVGVDWMAGRWLAAELRGREAAYRVFDSVEALCNAYEKEVEFIVIDVPIGLAECGEELDRRPDRAAREYLECLARKSSVFPAPLRPVVYAETKEEAWNRNKKLGGKLTPPGTGLLATIRQADEFLCSHPAWKDRLVESHPECALQALNGGKGLLYSKHQKEGKGLAERKAVLEQYVDNIDPLLGELRAKQAEDLLDALALAVTARCGFRNINEPVYRDREGIPMRIVVSGGVEALNESCCNCG